MLLILSLLLIISTVFCFQQNDYFIAFERFEVIRVNPKYVSSIKMITYKYNRTQPVLNATFDVAKDIGDDIDIIIQAYAFASNEYRLFPLHLGINLCKAIRDNDFGLGSIIQKGYFGGCPVNKGAIYIYNWIPDQSRFPPHIPNGKYKLDLQLKHFSNELGLVEGYGSVTRPLGRRH